jgi:hypothetical protein
MASGDAKNWEGEGLSLPSLARDHYRDHQVHLSKTNNEFPEGNPLCEGA